MDTRLVESLRTWKTFLRLKEGFTLTIPEPATVAKDPSAIVIFLLLGHGIYVLNFSDECHMLSSSWVNNPRAWKGHSWDTKSMRERKLTWMCKRANTHRFLQWTQIFFQLFNVLLIQFSKFRVVVFWLFLSRIISISYIHLALLLSPFNTTSTVDTHGLPWGF